MSEHGYFPPNEPTFGPADRCRYRLLMDELGFVVAVVWTSKPHGRSPAHAGITWSALTKTVLVLWQHLKECSLSNIDGGAAYESSVADTRGAVWLPEVEGSGHRLEACRRWVVGLTNEYWHAGAPFETPRAFTAHVGSAERIYLMQDPSGLPKRWLEATVEGRRVVRSSGLWLETDRTLGGQEIGALQPGFLTIFDADGAATLTDGALLQGLSLAQALESQRCPPDTIDLYTIPFDDTEAWVPRALVAETGQYVYVRDGRRWWKLPGTSGLVVDNDIQSVLPEFVPVWDALHNSPRENELARLARLYAAPDTVKPFDDITPSIAIRRSGVGPIFVGDCQNHVPYLAVAPREHRDGMIWFDAEGRLRFYDAAHQFSAHPNAVAIYHPVAEFHLKLRSPLWHDFNGPLGTWDSEETGRREVAELARKQIDPSRRIPVNPDLLLVDLNDGAYCADGALTIPPQGDPDEAKDIQEFLEVLAEEIGQRLLLPGSGGVPISKVEEWVDPLWIVDADVGMVFTEIWHLRLIYRPTELDDEEWMELIEDPDSLASLARSGGLEPEVPPAESQCVL